MKRKRKTKALSAPLKRLGHMFDRIEIATALESSDDERHRRLAILLRSPNHIDKVCSVGRLAQQCGIPYREIATVYRDYRRSEAIVIAAKQLPKIVEDIATDAESTTIPCSACNGKGYIVVQHEQGMKRESCLPCAGAGTIKKSGDAVARKQILEMMELAGKGVMNISAPGGQFVVGSESLEDTLRRARSARQPAQPSSDALLIEGSDAAN